MNTEEIGILFQLYAANSSIEANLWMMYVAATLACAGFGVSTNTLTGMRMAAIASVGFSAFAIGQFVMVHDAIVARGIMVQQLTKLAEHSEALKPFVAGFSPIGLTIPGAILTHCVVDVCIVALIMFRPVSLLRSKVNG